MKKKLNLLWNLKFNFFSVAERPLTFFAYFLNAKKVGRRRLVIVPAKAGASLFSHTRLPFPPRPLLPFGRISPAAKPRVRLPAPPFGFAAQNQARHFAARNHPVRLSASRPWLRHPAPVFCRPRHGSAAPGPQRQKPGPCSRSVAFRLRRNRAGRSLPPAGGNVLATPFSLCSNVAPRSHPGACRRSAPFRYAKPLGRSLPPPGREQEAACGKRGKSPAFAGLITKSADGVTFLMLRK